MQHEETTLCEDAGSVGAWRSISRICCIAAARPLRAFGLWARASGGRTSISSIVPPMFRPLGFANGARAFPSIAPAARCAAACCFTASCCSFDCGLGARPRRASAQVAQVADDRCDPSSSSSRRRRLSHRSRALHAGRVPPSATRTIPTWRACIPRPLRERHRSSASRRRFLVLRNKDGSPWGGRGSLLQGQWAPFASMLGEAAAAGAAPR